MTDLPDTIFHENDLLYFASGDDPLLWYVVPGSPAPDPGRGALALQTLGGHTSLALAARWLVPGAAELAALADTIRRRHGLAADVRVQAVPPPLLQLDGMVLQLADDGGTPQVLASSKTSGYAPWDAVFSAMLDAGAAARVRCALEQGRAGLLSLTVRYALNVPMTVKVRISGRMPAPDEALLARLAGNDDPDAAATLVEAALRSGDLHQEVDTALAAELPLVRDTCRQVLDQARMLVGLDLAGQVAAWRVHRDGAAKKQAPGGLLGKVFGNRHPAPAAAPFTGQPLSLDIGSSQTDKFRFPAQQTDASQSWLSVTTDLGAWAAQRRDSH